MAEDPEMDAKVNEALAAGGLSYQPGRVEVRHLLDVLYNDIGEAAIRDKVVRPLTGLRVAPYYGCQVVRPFDDVDNPEYPMKMDELFTWLGAEVVDYPAKAHCCGGHMTQISEPQAFELIRRLLQSAVDYDADMILCMCPMCQLNLDAYQGRVNGHFKTDFRMPIVFFTQIAGRGPGNRRRRLGFGKEIVRGRADHRSERLGRPSETSPMIVRERLFDTAQILLRNDGRTIMAEKSRRLCMSLRQQYRRHGRRRGGCSMGGRKRRGRRRRTRLQVHVLVARPADDRGRHQEAKGSPASSSPPALPACTKRRFAGPARTPGLNPFLFQMANIREHVSWVHATRPPATEKAKALVAAAAERVKRQQPLKPMHVKVNPATLVVGGGIAGLQATLELADAGYPVYLVEREPSIGGHMAQFDKTFPTLDCSACILTPQDVGSRAAREHHAVDLLRTGGGERFGGQFQGEDPPEGPPRRRDKIAPAAASASRNARRRSSTTTSRPAWATARPSTRPSPRPCPEPRSSTATLHLLPAGQCRVCEKLCPTGAIDFEQQDAFVESRGRQHHPGHRLEDVRLRADPAVRLRPAGRTSTRPWSSSGWATRPGPTGGKIVLRDGKTEPEVGRHHPLRRQPRRRTTTATARASAAWRL